MTEREEQAKAWLNRNYGMALELESIKRRLEKMQSDIEKVCKPIKLREIQESHSGNSQEDKMADYLDISEDLGKKYFELMAKDGVTLQVINKMDSPILRTILIERYINRLKWSKVAIIMHLEERQIMRYHVQALDAVLPFIPKEAKQ